MRTGERCEAHKNGAAGFLAETRGQMDVGPGSVATSTGGLGACLGVLVCINIRAANYEGGVLHGLLGLGWLFLPSDL